MFFICTVDYILRCCEQENYGSVLRDCSQALKINLKSSKALYRSSLALLALERVLEALDCCDRCLEFDKDNKGVLNVREKILKAKAAKERKERERSERIRKEEEEKRRLKAAFQVGCQSLADMHTYTFIISGTKSHPSCKSRWCFR